MRKSFSKWLIYLGVFSLILGTLNLFGINIAYASNVKVIGDGLDKNDISLAVKPSGTKLFDLKNLNPGDTEEEKIDIKNNHASSEIEVLMRTERKSLKPPEGDLFEQLILTIYLDGVEIYSGPMMNYAKNDISLGVFNLNQEKTLKAVVHLPGPETGNEFQGKALRVDWIFTARLYKEDITPPDKPDRPDRPTPPDSRPPIESRVRDKEIPDDDEEIIIDDEIPEDTPDIPEIEEEPEIKDEVPKIKETEVIEDAVPEDKVKLPRTGESGFMIYYGLGIAFLGIGTSMNKNSRKK